ncbi:endonuclease/exonuclease/phosphatase family protein [Paenibacillus rigui]|uniref:Endonuclease/exonuclease/phosphatase domain-containing protein n=1 Tax=Paenibacillus rigui TaxID=554312 RepID=A0A229UT50_9BACL|nr:endonuclease/exonuclease/phosphatase family protein [Paenibacillus rigui]OXM86503.1 hypothetical protein CF651_10045 [Paenibacillus rigui]
MHIPQNDSGLSKRGGSIHARKYVRIEACAVLLALLVSSLLIGLNVSSLCFQRTEAAVLKPGLSFPSIAAFLAPFPAAAASKPGDSQGAASSGDSSRASASAASASIKTLRFMTFNIRHAKGLDGQVRLAAIERQIEQGQADVVALQEVDRYQWRSGLTDQARALAGRLGMHYIFAPAVKQGLSEYGIALLSRYPVEQASIVPLSGGKEPRVVLEAVVKPRSNSFLTVVTTHLGVPHADRVQQVPELIRLIQSIHTPVVVMGDLNMEDTDPLMSDFHKLLTKVRLIQPQATVVDGGEIDHLLTSVAGQATAWTEPTTASDHVPVLGSIRVP